MSTKNNIYMYIYNYVKKKHNRFHIDMVSHSNLKPLCCRIKVIEFPKDTYTCMHIDYISVFFLYTKLYTYIFKCIFIYIYNIKFLSESRFSDHHQSKLKTLQRSQYIIYKKKKKCKLLTYMLHM